MLTVAESLGFLRGQLSFMRHHGFEIAVVTSPSEELLRFAEAEGVVAHAVDMPRRISPLRDLLATARLVLLLHRLRPDVVHAHTPKGGLLGMIAATLAGTPVRIYHMRGLPLATASGWKRRLLRMSERVSCALAHRVLCVSHSLRDAARAEGLCRDAVVLLSGSGNGVDLSRFDASRFDAVARAKVRAELAIPEDAHVVGFVGRLARDKGVRELLAAFRLVRARCPNAHLLLVGGNDVRDGIDAVELASAASAPHVHVLGHASDVVPLYAAMDLLVLPTYREGFPNALLEAAAMQLPVVATRVTGCIDAVVDGLSGTLVEPRDASALAAAILRYLEDAELRRRHGAAALERVRSRFAQKELWTALLTEYTSLLHRSDLAARRSEELTS